ncbi:MAG: capsid cement protein [Verrucomicrobiota bacterium]
MNTTENKTGYKALPAAVAIAEGQRVKLNGATWDVAAAADASPGVATHGAAAGEELTVKLFNAPGTFVMRANAGIVAGAQLYPTANGNVDDAGTTPLGLIAMEAATAANDLIECAKIEKGA